MVVGAALDEQARPVACALLPGYATGVKLFLPAIKGLQSRFEAGSFCVVADRRMVSLATVQALEAPGSGIEYILGCRMRGNKEVRDEVLGVDEDLVHEVAFERQASRDPLVLQLKEVHVADPRYVVRFNSEQANKGAADRQAIVESLTRVFHKV